MNLFEKLKYLLKRLFKKSDEKRVSRAFLKEKKATESDYFVQKANRIWFNKWIRTVRIICEVCKETRPDVLVNEKQYHFVCYMKRVIES